MPIAHKWHPIVDLPDEVSKLTTRELESLRRIWTEQKRELSELGMLEEFDKRLRREWSIETGIIENVYTLDRGVTNTLIEKGIDAALIPHGASDRDSTVVARVIQDHYDALEGMFEFVAGTRSLSVGYIRELHAALLRNQDTHVVVDQFGHSREIPLQKGAYKTLPNSPTRPDGSIHEYCPPEHVASEMDRLIDMYTAHGERALPPEIEAAWLHHRFAQIHPFADGNGRVARALASLVFIKADWFPLIIKREDWARYIDALEIADAGDLRSLVVLFIDAQREAVLQATDAAFDIRPTASVDDAIAALRAKLVSRGKVPPKDWAQGKITAERLAELAEAKLKDLAQRLKAELGPSVNFFFSTQRGPGSPDDERVQAIEQAGQKPDFVEFSSVVLLMFQSKSPDYLALSFHAIGPAFRGLIGVVPYLKLDRSPTPISINVTPFQINYEEDLETARTRFSEWLEQFVIAGLAEWRKTL